MALFVLDRAATAGIEQEEWTVCGPTDSPIELITHAVSTRRRPA